MAQHKTVAFALRAAACAAALVFAPATLAVARAPDRLEKVVILTRHGVRSAMSTPAQLGAYSARPWPAFAVPPGQLTARGAMLMQAMGRYYRAYYRRAGLLGPHDCAVYFHANHVPRTRDTAKALAAGLVPDCPVVVHEGPLPHDPLFEAREAGVLPQDQAALLRAIGQQAGGSLQRWERAQQRDLDAMQRLLWQCPPRRRDRAGAQTRCPAPGRPGADTPVVLALRGQPPELVLSSPALAISGLAESLLMGWADGHDFAALGWQGLDDRSLAPVFRVHAAAQRLRMHNAQAGRQNALCLAAQIAAILQTAPIATPCPPDPAMGRGDKMVIISGHDGTVMMLAGLLGLDWQVPGFGAGQAIPGGALVFERWRSGATGKTYLKLAYVAQTLAQLRQAQPLSLAHPPYRQAPYRQAIGVPPLLRR